MVTTDNFVKEISALSHLGDFFDEIVKFHQNPEGTYSSEVKQFYELILKEKHFNGWFDPGQVITSISNIASWLNKSTLENFLNRYHSKPRSQKRVGIIMAGNIPLVGFHDYLMAYLSGHEVLVKCSSDDNRLLPEIHKILMQFDPSAERISFVERIRQADAIIATGSNNTYRYFEYYFGNLPHIFRKNRNSLCIITGRETAEDLKKLAKDVFLFYGLGCRNVNYLIFPLDIDLKDWLKNFTELCNVKIENNKYINNYMYYRSVFAMNRIPYEDNGLFLLRKEQQLHSPVSVIHYGFYKNNDQLANFILDHKDDIQCIVGKHEFCNVAFGKSQFPAIDEFADNVDTLSFLMDEL